MIGEVLTWGEGGNWCRTIGDPERDLDEEEEEDDDDDDDDEDDEEEEAGEEGGEGVDRSETLGDGDE